MAKRVRNDDERPDELLEEHGRIAYRLGLAIAWTSGIRDAKAKMAADRGSGAWKRAAPLSDEAFAAGMFKERCRTRNPVCAAGASGLVLVEVDGDESLLDTIGVVLPQTVTARSRRGLHRYYAPAEGCAPAKYQIAEDGVTLVEDGYLVMPPALHPSGAVYQWVNNGGMTELPAETYRLLARLHDETEHEVEAAVGAGGKVPEGHRRRYIFLRALEMAHAGLGEAEILPSMLALGRDRCEPPLSDQDVRQQVAGAVKRTRTKPRLQAQLALAAEAELSAAIAAAPEVTRPPTPERPGVMSTKRGLSTRAVSTITARPQRWLLPGLIPLGAQTLVAGVGGFGKSTLTCQWIARLTRGELGVVGSGLVVSFEDAAEEVIRPRLEAAGADLERAYVLVKEGGILTLPNDLAELTRTVQETDARLLVIDPVSAALSLKLDAHRDQDVRVVLGELDRIAKELELAIVLVAHLNKSPSGDAYIRIGGSTAFYNACRSVITVTLDPEDEDCRLVAQHKANYARLSPVQRHRIEQVVLEANGESIVTSKMVYVEDAEDVDPYRVLEHRDERPPTKRDRAATLLTALLADGMWHDREPAEELSAAQGIGRRTFERAAETLGVESELHGVPPRARWRLPIASAPTSDAVTQLDGTA